tara:strand:- start:632 stop:1360 length:729 start_codon:yes stop_codon:yes gene_type:complete
MPVSIHEKVNQLTTNLMEVAGIPDTITGLYAKLSPTTRNIFFSDVEGMRKFPGSFQNIVFQGALGAGKAAQERGAGEGAAMGAAGGGLLGAGVASMGIPKIGTDFAKSFTKGLDQGPIPFLDRRGKKGTPKTAKGKLASAAVRGLMGLGGGALKAAGLGAAGGLAGAGSGAVAGFRGGRESGAAILGAGAAGGPIGALAGPIAGAGGALLGGGIGSDLARAYIQGRKSLQVGGDPRNLVFKQ